LLFKGGRPECADHEQGAIELVAVEASEAGLGNAVEVIREGIADGSEAVVDAVAFEVGFLAGGGQVRVVNGEDQATAVPEHVVKPAEDEVEPVEMFADQGAEDGIEIPWREREGPVQVRLDERGSGQAAARDTEHAKGEVEADGRDARLDEGAEVAPRAATGVEDAFTRLGVEDGQGMARIHGNDGVVGSFVGFGPEVVAWADAGTDNPHS
jgi:hypothetical protein